MEAAARAKETIYGKRMVMFAPLYTGNHCSNNCLYCGFRKDNKELKRRKLEQDEIAQQTRILIKEDINGFSCSRVNRDTTLFPF